MSWEDAWNEGRTPWDAGSAAPALEELLANPPAVLAASFHRRTPSALVLGCGTGYDVLALAAAGYRATGLDIAPKAADRFHELRKERGVDGAQARVAVADFFGWKPAQPFDLVWDYTFLCALSPASRHRWGQRVSELVAPDGALATLIFPMVGSPQTEGMALQGPPYPLFPKAVARALHRNQQAWTAVRRRTPARSHPGREGKEALIVWRRVL